MGCSNFRRGVIAQLAFVGDVRQRNRLAIFHTADSRAGKLHILRGTTHHFRTDFTDALLQLARLAGFSQESFEACLTNQKLLDDVRAVRLRGADEFGVDATPTFFINGNKYSGALSVDEMSAIIDSML